MKIDASTGAYIGKLNQTMDTLISFDLDPSSTYILIGGKYLSYPAFQRLDIATMTTGNIYKFTPGIQVSGEVETIKFLDNDNFIIHTSVHTGAPAGFNYDFLGLYNYTDRKWGVFVNKTNQLIVYDAMQSIEVLANEVISFIPDFANSDYILLYKVSHSTGLVTDHKKVIYDTTTIKWERNYIKSYQEITYLSLGISYWRTLIVLNNTDFSLIYSFDLKTSIPSWHAKVGGWPNNTLFFGYAASLGNS